VCGEPPPDVFQVGTRTISRLICFAAVVAAAAALLPAQASPSTAGSRSSLASLRTGVLAQLNEIRRAHGLVPLTLNRELSAAANQHSTEMLAKGYFAHESANGSAFWKRLQRFYPSSRFRYWSVGENLVWSAGSLDQKRALELWMASPEHRENILTPRWREIGISALQEANAPGTFSGNSVTLITTDFGVRR
jgi:uncharacterized protein YkwD